MAAKDSVSPKLFRMHLDGPPFGKQMYYEGHTGKERVFQATVDAPQEIINPDVYPDSDVDLGSTELFHHIPPRVSLGVVVPGHEVLSGSVSQDVKKVWGEYPTIGTYSELGPMKAEEVREPSELLYEKVPVYSKEEIHSKVHGNDDAPEPTNKLSKQFTQPRLPGM